MPRSRLFFSFPRRDLNEDLFADEDILLLCSDGLTKELSDTQIARVLANVDAADAAAKQLIKLAKDSGGNDNITVIVLRHAPKLAGIQLEFFYRD